MPRLVFSRVEGESFEFDGPGKVTIVANYGRRIKIAVDAPETTRIVRSEIAHLPRSEKPPVSTETKRLNTKGE